MSLTAGILALPPPTQHQTSLITDTPSKKHGNRLQSFTMSPVNLDGPPGTLEEREILLATMNHLATKECG